MVLQQDYVTADETYHKVLLTRTKSTDKGSKEGYLWAVCSPKQGLVFFIYEDGSRSEEVILDVFDDYKVLCRAMPMWRTREDGVRFLSRHHEDCLPATRQVKVHRLWQGGQGHQRVSRWLTFNWVSKYA